MGIFSRSMEHKLPSRMRRLLFVVPLQVDIARREITSRRPGDEIGAGRRIRTDDLLITNQLLYQLSYAGNTRAA
jgi:hypothetical protein